MNDRGEGSIRLDRLRGYVRSSLRLARVVLDELLDPRFSHEEPEKYQNLAIKVGGEMAMLLRMAKRALPGEDDGREINELARDLAPHARSAYLRRSLVMRPSRAPMHALAHLCLTDIGLPDEAMDRLARRALGASANNANERVPYRMLDAAWTRHIAFDDAELDHPAMRLSPLGAGVDLIDPSTEDAYAFTHALPYATDFGRVALPADLDRDRLLNVAEALAAKALDEDDLDLLAEVLMAPAILRLRWTPTLTFGWNVMERVWNEFGFVPGPGIPPGRENETRTQTVRRVLGTTYHTCFAAGLCCATLVACQNVPPEARVGETGSIQQPPGKGAMWKIDWDRRSHKEQSDLVFLSLAFSLRRAIENCEFAVIRNILATSAQVGLLEHPLFTQSLELLERLQP